MKYKIARRPVALSIAVALVATTLITLGLLPPEQVAGASEEPSSYDVCSNVSCQLIVPDFVMLLPHPESCNKFCLCDWGVPISMTCPQDLHFNPTLMVCDWPANAGCTVESGGGQ